MKKKKYEVLTDEILKYIEENDLKKGAKLPKVRDIIKGTGFSYATVNRTLLEMEKSGYISKTQGSGIFVNKIDSTETDTKQVAFVIPKAISKGKIFLDILNGLRRKFEKEGIHLIVSISNMSHEKEKLTIERMVDKHVDGLVLFLEDNYRFDYSHIEQLKENKYPFVLVDRFVPELDTDYVVINNLDAMVRVCSYLKYKESCDSIIYITHEDTATSHDEKVSGYTKAASILYPNQDAKILTIEEFCDKHNEIDKPNKKIGLCFWDDLGIVELKLRLLKKNKILSENFRIFGYNNCYEIRDFPSVEQFNDKVGENAAELLIKRMDRPNIETKHVRIEPKLVFPDGKGGYYYED
ncbi:MAG: LacI family DNA-binding transcriptional regulator [Melioribacteraceae bacterium]|nr:LacI family DNA-binding transcriptional regulator [Melioribacteraceae bacterium]